MSQTFTLTGEGSVLSVNYFPPIELNPNYSYGLGLAGFYGCNSIRNIYEGNNKFYYASNKVVTIPSGAYEIKELNNYLHSQINLPHQIGLIIRPNNNTLKVEIKSAYVIDFTPADSIGRMLGFSPKKLWEKGKVYESDLDVQIIKATNIHVECNITGGAYRNNTLSHTIYEFDISVEPGFKLVKEPSPVIYLPLLGRQIDNITLRLVDQDGNLVDFGNEKVTIRLELKPNGFNTFR